MCGIRERQQRHAQERFSRTRQLEPQTPEGPQRGDAEERGGQPQTPHAFAERRDRKVRQDGKQKVLILRAVGRDDVAKRRPNVARPASSLRPPRGRDSARTGEVRRQPSEERGPIATYPDPFVTRREPLAVLPEASILTDDQKHAESRETDPKQDRPAPIVSPTLDPLTTGAHRARRATVPRATAAGPPCPSRIPRTRQTRNPHSDSASSRKRRPS